MPATRGRRTVTPPAAKPRNDVYTGLLVLSLLAMLAGTLLLYLDYSKYPAAKPTVPPQRQAGSAAQPANPLGGGQPPAPPAPQPAPAVPPAPAVAPPMPMPPAAGQPKPNG